MKFPFTLAVSAVFLFCSSSRAEPRFEEIHVQDAQRFAKLMENEALPTAMDLERGYLEGASRGVQIFIPHRIENADKLARRIAAHPEHYRHAITHCLPLLPVLQAELRSIYSKYSLLLPEMALPAVYLVFGAGTSGGTAAQGAQVIGLEVMCKAGTTTDQFVTSMRGLLAHETVHSWQRQADASAWRDLLLMTALREGVPDYLASLATGAIPDAARDAWAKANETWLWKEFEQDRQALVNERGDGAQLPDSPEGMARFKRWFANAGRPPEGWPSEAGYWIGMRIAQAYVNRAPDRGIAIRELIEMRDPLAILAASGYRPSSTD
ncbi:hypothetical protein WDZ92_34480 [Nostoc sp. NIES-2111]